MSDKITLAPGQQNADYVFAGNSFEEVGRKLDDFYARLDYQALNASTDIPLSVDVYRISSMQEVIRTSIGGYEAAVSVSRHTKEPA